MRSVPLDSSYSYKSVMKDRYFSTAAAADPSQVQAALTITLYQHQICHFCNAAEAACWHRYAHVPYEAVQVNPWTKAESKWYVHNLCWIGRLGVPY